MIHIDKLKYVVIQCKKIGIEKHNLDALQEMIDEFTSYKDKLDTNTVDPTKSKVLFFESAGQLHKIIKSEETSRLIALLKQYGIKKEMFCANSNNVSEAFAIADAYMMNINSQGYSAINVEYMKYIDNEILVIGYD